MSAPPGDIVLETNEHVLIATKPLALWTPAVVVVVALWIAAVWGWLALGSPGLGVAGVVAAAAVTLYLGVRWLRWRGRWFVLTDRRLITRSGVLNRTQSAILLERLQDVTLTRPFPMSYLAGYGVLELESAGEHSTERLAMEHADEFHRLLTDAVTPGR